MPEWMIYAGCALQSLLVVGGGIKPVVKGYNLLHKYFGLTDYWDDATEVGCALVLLLAALGLGAVYGHESEVMGHSWRIGVVWSTAGACSTWAMPAVRRRIRSEIETRQVEP